MRRLLAFGSCLVLVAACSDSGSTASTTSAAATVTTVGAVTSTSGAAAAAPLTPEVVCVANNGRGDGIEPDYAFSYTNDSAQPVVLAAQQLDRRPDGPEAGRAIELDRRGHRLAVRLCPQRLDTRAQRLTCFG